MREISFNFEAVVSFVLVCIAWTILAGSMFYRIGSGEHDTFMMAAGIVHGVKTDHVINSMNYGNDLQFIFYYAMHYLARSFALDGGDLLLLMNSIGAVMA